jgi:hypothetical protein
MRSRRSTLPDSGCGRRLHPRMPDARCRYLAAGPACSMSSSPGAVDQRCACPTTAPS